MPLTEYATASAPVVAPVRVKVMVAGAARAFDGFRLVTREAHFRQRGVVIINHHRGPREARDEIAIAGGQLEE